MTDPLAEARARNQARLKRIRGMRSVKAHHTRRKRALLTALSENTQMAVALELSCELSARPMPSRALRKRAYDARKRAEDISVMKVAREKERLKRAKSAAIRARAEAARKASAAALQALLAQLPQPERDRRNEYRSAQHWAGAMA